MALNAGTPSTCLTHWHKDKCHAFLLRDMWKQLYLCYFNQKAFVTFAKLLFSRKLELEFGVLKEKSWKWGCKHRHEFIYWCFPGFSSVDTNIVYVLHGSYFQVLDGFKPNLILGLLCTADLCKEWTLPQKIPALAQSEAGDSCLNDFCAHFLRKLMRKLNRTNRTNCILCIVTYWMVWCGRWCEIFFLLTCCPYGTIRWGRKWCLLAGSTLTKPALHCCCPGAALSSTRTDLNAKSRTEIKWGTLFQCKRSAVEVFQWCQLWLQTECSRINAS